MPVRTFEDLQVWQRSMELVDAVYRASRMLPNAERFGLCSQMCRAAVSIPANVAEGYGRLHRGDYVHHLSIANGSLRELQTHLHIARRQSYLAKDVVAPILALSEEVARMLWSLRLSLGARH